jgi:hypothetical protein
VNDLDLIRSFRSHVDPPDAERVAAARAAVLARYDDALRQPRRRPARLRPALAALLTVPAIAAIAVVLIAGVFGGSGTPTAGAAIIRHADAALSPPPHEILHTKVAGDGFVAEWWQLTSPPYSFLGDKGPVGAAPEMAGDGTTTSFYDPATNTIHVQSNAPQSAFDDPLAQVRQALRDGNARVLGDAVVNGAATYKIQFADKNGFSSQSLIAYVDQRTYRPVLLSDPQRDGTVVHLRVVTLEYLPATSANLQSLSLTARHPTASVVIDPPGKSVAGGK